MSKITSPALSGLAIALGVSLLLHGIALSIHFELPDALSRASERALDVILVNSKSAHKPTEAQAKAQTNLDGGGNTDADRRASTPLPPSAQTKEGNDLIEAQQRVSQLEAMQQQLLTQAKSKRSVNSEKLARDPQPKAPQTLSGMDLASSAMTMARLEAQIDKNLDEYNKRPRKKFIGNRTEEYRFTQYVEDWRQKIERIGNLNYPAEARGRLSGSLRVLVLIRSDGTLSNVSVTKSSGEKVLDDAAVRIVKMAAPYAVFPDAIRRDTDEVEIERYWTFTKSDTLRTDK